MKNFLYELKLSYNRTGEYKKYDPIRSSKDVYQILSQVFDPDLMEAREEFVILYLNRANVVIGYYKAFQGGVSAVVADTKLILSMGLKSLASGVILAHNHPSGRVEPSDQDLRLTRRVKEACKLVDLELLDHMIMSADNGYYSFADEGKL
ncbi:RadC family protein [Algoriphagus sp. AK58]|uniref:JAB domain-containing protein n=1 Tax=Algoriphagus sp. AK58 TaxID=1406877 RepID=UPI00164FC612|nr:JAB domain-containing protein [Algoriphagus sp. AK58]MBC6368028.1 DNA repair protein [Algoriphagus sp. AK58]